MKNKIKNINKDIVKRKNYLKNELKKIVLKSIIQNNNIKPSYRALALKKISKFKKIAFISKQNNNICLKTGRYKGVLKLTQVSRHSLKNLAIFGSLQNFKTKSW